MIKFINRFIILFINCNISLLSNINYILERLYNSLFHLEISFIVVGGILFSPADLSIFLKVPAIIEILETPDFFKGLILSYVSSAASGGTSWIDTVSY